MQFIINYYCTSIHVHLKMMFLISLLNKEGLFLGKHKPRTHVESCKTTQHCLLQFSYVLKKYENNLSNMDLAGLHFILYNTKSILPFNKAK